MTSMMSSLQSSTSCRPTPQRHMMFSRVDANSDGTVSQDEFVLARPKHVSEHQAASLFHTLDANKSGTLNEAELSLGGAKHKPAGVPGLSGNLVDEMLAALLQFAQQASMGMNPAAKFGPPSADGRFARLDRDGDGNASKAEFIAARPEGVSEDQAGVLFDRIDKEGTGAVSQAKLEGGMKEAGVRPPPPPPPPPPVNQASSADMLKLLSAIQAYVSSSNNYSNESAAPSSSLSEIA